MIVVWLLGSSVGSRAWHESTPTTGAVASCLKSTGKSAKKRRCGLLSSDEEDETADPADPENVYVVHTCEKCERIIPRRSHISVERREKVTILGIFLTRNAQNTASL